MLDQFNDAATVGSSDTKVTTSAQGRCGITTAGTIACGGFAEAELTAITQETGWTYLTGGATTLLRVEQRAQALLLGDQLVWRARCRRRRAVPAESIHPRHA